jgi:hypothetical protein
MAIAALLERWSRGDKQAYDQSSFSPVAPRLVYPVPRHATNRKLYKA